MTFLQTSEALPLSEIQKEVVGCLLLIKIVIVRYSVIANNVAFFTVTDNGALTYGGGMPTLPTAAH